MNQSESKPPLIPRKLFGAFLWLSVIVLSFYLLVIGRELLIPLVLAFFVWYLVHTLHTLSMSVKLGKRKIPRWLGFTLSAAIIVIPLLLLFAMITDNVSQVQQKLPEYQDKVQESYTNLLSRFHVDAPEAVDNWVSGLDFSSLLRQAASTMASLAGSGAMVLAYLFFIFLEQRFFHAKLKALLPNGSRRADVEKIISQIDHDIRVYIGVKTLVSALTAIFAYAIMRIAGLDFAEFWAVLIFVLNFIPNIGSLIATALPAGLAFVQLELGWFLFVGLGILAVQLTVANFVEPNLMGKSLNQSPLVIILMLVLWGSLWGLAGMFLCVPITVVVMIVLSHFPNTRWVPIMLSLDGRVKGHPQVEAASE